MLEANIIGYWILGAFLGIVLTLASKTEVSRQLVYMLGGQSEPDTDHQGCRGQIALTSNGRQRRPRWHGTITLQQQA